MISLQEAATAIQANGRDAVQWAMLAALTPSPWQVSEATLQVAALRALHHLARRDDDPARLFGELKHSGIANLPESILFEKGANHPYDIVVGYPFDLAERPDSAIDAQGLVEIKKNYARACAGPSSDGSALSAIVQSVDMMPETAKPLLWVMSVVFVNGSSRTFSENCARLTRDMSALGMNLLTSEPTPQRAPTNLPGIDQTTDVLFDILCFGRSTRSLVRSVG